MRPKRSSPVSRFPCLVNRVQTSTHEQELNERDRIQRRMSAAKRRLVITAFEPVAGHSDLIAGRFDIVLGPPGAARVTPQLD